MKKTIILLFVVFLLSSLVAAESLNIEFPSGNEFEAGNPLTFKVTLYDNSGNPIDGQINIIIEDATKRATTKTISSKEITSIELGEKTSSGQGTITATYNEIETIAFFEIGRKEIASFELKENKLIVTNIGNAPYTKTIKITIGNTEGTQEPNLDIGESISYRLIAPEGVYNIKVTDGKTSLIRSEIKLTGQAIGAIDDTPSGRTGITGGVSPDQNSDIALISYIQKNKFVYVFIGVIFAAVILIGVERRYKKNS